jgi:hypothetical protein
MTRWIFRILIIASILIGIYLYIIRETQSSRLLIIWSSITFLILSFGIHGLIAHSMRPKTKGDLIAYPLLMWILWAVLFFLFVFLVIPVFYPDFLMDV